MGRVVDAKKSAIKSKQANILGTEAREWGSSTIADQKIQKDTNHDLKRQLLKVRAGLMDEYSQKPAKMHSEERVEEQQRYVVRMTGHGPVGKLSGKWMNAVVEQKEEKRRERMKTYPHLNAEGYINPADSIVNVNDGLRERKIEWQALKEQFKVELKVEFPNASEERLQAMARRLLNEKLLADEKLARFPIQHESFRPNLSLTTQDRRFKKYYHPGRWAWNEAE